MVKNPQFTPKCTGGGGRFEIYFTSDLSTSIYPFTGLERLIENFDIVDTCRILEGYHLIFGSMSRVPLVVAFASFFQNCGKVMVTYE